MRYTIVSSVEFTYPDIWDYPSSSSKPNVFAARGGYATFQILIDNAETDDIAISVNGLPENAHPEFYTLLPIYVEDNPKIPPEKRVSHFPERIAPYYIFDCLKDFDGKIDTSQGFGGIYVSIKIDKNAKAGDYSCVINLCGESIPLNLKIYNAVIPEESLKVIVGYYSHTVAKYHNAPYGSDKYFELEKQYISLLRRMRQNMMYTSGIKATSIGENKWKFDFSEFIAQVKRFDAAGIKYFNAPTVGWRRSWSGSEILLLNTIDSMSYEGYCYLTQYLPALRDVLIEHGWLDRFVMGVADEPNVHNCTVFRALCGLVRKIFPEMRLMDAMSYGNVHGSLDVWVPLNSSYEEHREQIETLRASGDEIWHYVCCVPRNDMYINRFMDYPLLSTRYLHWGNYKYDLTGYLHWSSNCYQPEQDPFKQNCPQHRNTDSVSILPPGDTHIIYPGNTGPWMSIRLEAERESAEEYELLRYLAKTDKAKADAICDKVFHSFKDVEYDVNKFIAVKKELLEALS